MFYYIEKVRKMPMTKRKIIAFFLTFFVTFIIAYVWFLVWFPSLKQDLGLEEKNKALTPTENIAENFKTAFSDIKDTLSTVKQIDVSGIVGSVSTSTNSDNISTLTPKKDAVQTVGPKPFLANPDSL
jgi:ABC-type glycerol-3-phosphate transport system permease component